MMRIYFIVFVLVLSASTSCKKNKQEDPPVDPAPHEKKWVVTTVAGNGLAYFADGPALMAAFRAPLDVAVGEDGTIYVADAINHRIRKISDGLVSTFAGVGIQDTTSGRATVAGFAFPSYLAFDTAWKPVHIRCGRSTCEKNIIFRFCVCCCRIRS